MKRRLLLASVLAVVLSFGTFFFEFDTSSPQDVCNQAPNCEAAIDNVTNRGFPLDFVKNIEYNDTFSQSTNQELVEAFQDRTSVAVGAAVLNFLSWFVVVFLGLLIIEWLASLVGKLFIRLIIGLVASAYGLLLILG